IDYAWLVRITLPGTGRETSPSRRVDPKRTPRTSPRRPCAFHQRRQTISPTGGSPPPSRSFQVHPRTFPAPHTKRNVAGALLQGLRDQASRTEGRSGDESRDRLLALAARTHGPGDREPAVVLPLPGRRSR